MITCFADVLKGRKQINQKYIEHYYDGGETVLVVTGSRYRWLQVAIKDKLTFDEQIFLTEPLESGILGKVVVVPWAECDYIWG